jgi:hypothetical protein
MYKKFIVLVVALFGLATFFLPLVRVQAPFAGTQSISGWDVVKPGEPKKQRRDLGLGDTLDKIQEDFLKKARRDAPFSVKQAQALVVTLPLAYLSFAVGGILILAKKERALQVTAAVGALAGFYSLLSVFWLRDGLKQMVAGSSKGGIPLFGGLRKAVAGQVDVNPETGLYLLVAALAGLLLVSFLPAGKR